MVKLPTSQTLYDVLKVDAGVGEAELRKAYRNAALRAHPDKEGGSKEAFHIVTVAYEVLSCPITRVLYHRSLNWSGGHVDNGMVPIQLKNEQKVRFVAKSKTCSNDTSSGLPTNKRQRRQSNCSAVNQHIRCKLDKALDYLRAVLQSMAPMQREGEIMNLSPQIRLELKQFMEQTLERKSTSHDGLTQSGQSANKLAGKAGIAKKLHERCASSYGIRKIYQNKGCQRIKYQASIQVKALRLYTCEQGSFETAVEHQIILVKIKNTLHSMGIADKEFWFDSKKILSACGAVFRSLCTSEAKLGLRAWVHMRASRWLLHRYRISASATTLSQAVMVHGRLLRARETSWECLRSHWVSLIQKKSKRACVQQAEEYVDRARRNTLQEHVSRAVKGVRRVLDQRARKRCVNRDDVQSKRVSRR